MINGANREEYAAMLRRAQESIWVRGWVWTILKNCKEIQEL
jgi:hypothetical protein